MRAAIALAMLVLPSGCSAQRKVPQATSQPEIEILIRRDSVGLPTLAVDELRFPPQAPWHGEFFVHVRIPRRSASDGLEARVGIEVWMGPQLYGGPDGELLLAREADRLGSWYRSDIERVERLSPTASGDLEGTLGPFPLLGVIPGPRGANARLWPTRLKVVLDIIPLDRWTESTANLHWSKVVVLR